MRPEEENFEEHFDYSDNIRVVTVKFFYFESQARLYAARLREAGIACFLSNINSSTIIALGEGGIGLNVKEADAVEALGIIRELDKFAKQEQVEQSFHDADKEDILYEKEIQKAKENKWSPLTVAALLIVFLLLLHSFLLANGLVQSWWDLF